MGSKGQRLSGWTDLYSFVPRPLPPRVTLGRSQKAGWTLSFFISRLMLMKLLQGAGEASRDTQVHAPHGTRHKVDTHPGWLSLGADSLLSEPLRIPGGPDPSSVASAGLTRSLQENASVSP